MSASTECSLGYSSENELYIPVFNICDTTLFSTVLLFILLQSQASIFQPDIRSSLRLILHLNFLTNSVCNVFSAWPVASYIRLLAMRLEFVHFTCYLFYANTCNMVLWLWMKLRRTESEFQCFRYIYLLKNKCLGIMYESISSSC